MFYVVYCILYVLQKNQNSILQPLVLFFHGILTGVNTTDPVERQGRRQNDALRGMITRRIASEKGEAMGVGSTTREENGAMGFGSFGLVGDATEVDADVVAEGTSHPEGEEGLGGEFVYVEGEGQAVDRDANRVEKE
jgi:hypothetical protein